MNSNLPSLMSLTWSMSTDAESPAASWQIEAPDFALAAADGVNEADAVGLAVADVLDDAAGEVESDIVAGAQAVSSSTVQASRLHGFFMAS